MTACKGQWKSASWLIVRSLVAALVISSVVYGVRGFESVFEQWAWWLPPLGLTVVLSVGLWLVRRPGPPRPVALRPAPADEQQSTPDARSSVPLLQNMMEEVIQTIEGTVRGRRRRQALHAWPWYLLMGASASGKTGLLEGLARLTPPVVRPPAHLVNPTSGCNWWVFQTAAILDTCGRYTSSIPQTQDHDAWYDVLEFLRSARARQPLNGILFTVAADALGVQPLELLRRDALTARQRLHEARRALGRDIPLYIVITRCDLIEGFVGFFAQLPEYIRTQVFGWVHDTRLPGKQPQHRPGGTLPDTSMSATLTRRLDQLRLFVLNDALRSGTSRQQLFCFPENFAPSNGAFVCFSTRFVSLMCPLMPPMCAVCFLGVPSSGACLFLLCGITWVLRHPCRLWRKVPESYFLHDLLTVILPRDRHLARPASMR